MVPASGAATFTEVTSGNPQFFSNSTATASQPGKKSMAERGHWINLVTLCGTLKFVYDIGPPIVPFSTHSRLLDCFLSLSGREKIEILK